MIVCGLTLVRGQEDPGWSADKVLSHTDKVISLTDKVLSDTDIFMMYPGWYADQILSADHIRTSF